MVILRDALTQQSTADHYNVIIVTLGQFHQRLNEQLWRAQILKAQKRLTI